MHQVLSSNLWSRLRKLIDPKARIRGAVAYCTYTNGLSFKADDALIVDASAGAIGSGQTDAKALQQLHSRGVELYSCESLHAKFLQVGHVTIIGSANLSRSSSEVLIEACVATDHPVVLSQTLALFESLKGTSIKLTSKALKKLLTIPVIRAGGKKPSRAKRFPQDQSFGRTWLVGVTELAEDAYPNEADEVEEGELEAQKVASDDDADISWLRFTGNSAFRKEARPGDSVVQLWRPRGKKGPSKAICHSPILIRQDVGRRTRFYVEGSEMREVGFSKFISLAKSAGIKGRLGTSTQRLLTVSQSDALFALWPSRRAKRSGEEE